jgi:MFS family permease
MAYSPPLHLRGLMPDTPPVSPQGWASLKLLKPYQWFVFVVCCLAWDLDCLDQQLFVLARVPAVAALVGKPPSDNDVKFLGGLATAIFMVGWAVGGLGFGILGDRMGRVKTLTATIGLYALFTGLSALSVGVNDFLLYRFLTGLGVGGAFAAAVVLLAESVPDVARPYVIGLYQASSVLGNCGAALISLYLSDLQAQGQFPKDGWWAPWRVMFLIGILPGILLVIVQFTLKEPEKWKAMRAAELAGVKPPSFFGTLAAMLTTKPWGQRAIFGLLLTGAGVIGLWGIGFFVADLVGLVIRPVLKADGFEGPALDGEVGRWKSYASLVQNAGAFLGMFTFSWVTGRVGRKKAFFVAFVLGSAMTAYTFLNLKTREDIFWMIPMMGFCQLAVFGGFAIYLPELFPTRYRSTGTSFCYNAGRLLAAAGPFTLGYLSTGVFKGYGDDAIRYAGATLSIVFLMGIAALPFLPETKGQPLPE